MLDAFLQDDDYFSELLHYCNILYEMLPTILGASHLRAEKDARKLAAIAVVAAGAHDVKSEKSDRIHRYRKIKRFVAARHVHTRRVSLHISVRQNR